MMMMMMIMILPDIVTKTCKSSIVLMVSALNIVVALRPTSAKTCDISAWLFCSLRLKLSRWDRLSGSDIFTNLFTPFSHPIKLWRLFVGDLSDEKSSRWGFRKFPPQRCGCFDHRILPWIQGLWQNRNRHPPMAQQIMLRWGFVLEVQKFMEFWESTFWETVFWKKTHPANVGIE